MHELLKLTKELDSKWQEIEEYIASENLLETITETFTSKQFQLLSEEYKSVNNKFGVYAFYIRPSLCYTLESLKDHWTEESYKNYPKISEKRFKNCPTCSLP